MESPPILSSCCERYIWSPSIRKLRLTCGVSDGSCRTSDPHGRPLGAVVTRWTHPVVLVGRCRRRHAAVGAALTVVPSFTLTWNRIMQVIQWNNNNHNINKHPKHVRAVMLNNRKNNISYTLIPFKNMHCPYIQIYNTVEPWKHIVTLTLMSYDTKYINTSWKS